MSDFFQWKEKRETVASEKEPSFGSDKKKDPAKKASDKNTGEAAKKQLHSGVLITPSKQQMQRLPAASSALHQTKLRDFLYIWAIAPPRPRNTGVLGLHWHDSIPHGRAVHSADAGPLSLLETGRNG